MSTYDEIEKHIDDSIRQTGWAVTGVFADTTSDSPAFVYSTGLTLMKLPEVLVVGDLPVKLMADMLNHVIKNQLDGGEFTEGLVDGHMSIKGGETLRCWLRPVENQAKARNYALKSHYRYGDEATYWQLLWADDKNILPTEEGYAVRLRQPVL